MEEFCKRPNKDLQAVMWAQKAGRGTYRQMWSESSLCGSGFQVGVCVYCGEGGEGGILRLCTVGVEIERDRDLWAERRCIEDHLFIPHLASLQLLCEKTGSFPLNGHASNYLLTFPNSPLLLVQKPMLAEVVGESISLP